MNKTHIRRHSGARHGAAIAAIVLSVVLVGCNRNVDTFRAVIRHDDAVVPLRLENVGRRSTEEEGVIVESAHGRHRFRVRGPENGDEIDDGTPSTMSAIVLDVSGDPQGASIELAHGEVIDRIDVSSFYRAVSGGPGRYSLRIDVSDGDSPLLLSDLADVEISLAAGVGRRFAVDGIAFATTAESPRLSLAAESNERFVIDSRVPVARGEGEWHFFDVAALVPRRTDALVIGYRQDPAAFVDYTDPIQAIIEFTDESGRSEALSLRVRPGRHDIVVRPHLWGVAADQVRIFTPEPGFFVEGLHGVRVDENRSTPIPVEMSELLMYPASEWRNPEFELFSWSLYPDLLWIDSRDYATQARMFRRLAFFVEKRGFQGRLLSDEELANRHGWNAHNYRPEGLADFFNAVAETEFPINELERELRAIALERGVLVAGEGDRVLPGIGGVLAISQESYLELRRLLLVHEAIHGVFYEEPAFRDAAFGYWDDELSPRERAYWMDFLSWMTYSPDDRYLMVNEFQAYLLQQRQTAVRWYFRTRIADRLRRNQPTRINEIDRFLQDHPTTFVRSGEAMNRALFEIAGMVGGDPFCLVPVDAEG